MHRSKKKLYESIKDLKTKQEFEKEIKKKSLEIDNLLDEDTIALLIVDELGRNDQVITNIVDLRQDSEYTVIGKVVNIYESRQFKRKNGKRGKVINLDITDDTGLCRLVLWNNDVDLIKNKNINKGTWLKIINGYTKNGYSGIELNLGRWGLLELESNQINVKNDKNSNDINELKGELIKKDATKVFFKDNGDVGFVTNIKINSDGLEKQITLWDKRVKEVQKIKVGEELIITGITIKNKNGIEEFHANENSKLNGC